MNTPHDPFAKPPCVFWPKFFLVQAFVIFLASQICLTWNGTSQLKAQEKAISQQLERSRNEIAQARNMQNLLEGMANDLLNLASTDSEVRKIVDKYQIRKKTSTTSSTQPTP